MRADESKVKPEVDEANSCGGSVKPHIRSFRQN